MPQPDEPGVHLRPPVLDRLIDEEPEATSEAVPSYRAVLRATLEAVRRDLQWLLNARRSEEELRARDQGEIALSPAAFGIPDMTSVNFRSEREKERVRRALEEAIARFEPRLSRVRVQVADHPSEEFVSRFRIEAWLRVDPTPERVAFDTAIRWQDRDVRVESVLG